MSEIRRVKVEIKDLESIKESCEEMGIQMDKLKENLYVLQNHGIKTYGNTPVSLEEVGGVWQIKADAYVTQLNDLEKRMRKSYNVKLAEKAAKKLGYTIVKKEDRNGKKVIRLRIFK